MRPMRPPRAALLSLFATRRALSLTLITFDVDGTLVRGSGQSSEASVHARAFAHALGTTLGDGRTPTRLPREALPGPKYHGSTDGLILLNLARAELGLAPATAAPRLPELMNSMHEFVASRADADVVRGVEPLDGVLPTLRGLAADDRAVCALVTGNVEGIARKKMRAVGVAATGALAPAHPEQLGRAWPGDVGEAFLGGFGSDFCSGDIDDATRQHLDRAEQIVIAHRRAADGSGGAIRRVVHVGDAPNDVLAARACALDRRLGEGVTVGCVGVATGSYGAEELRACAGEPVPGLWEPVVLEDGIADPGFVAACGLDSGT